MQEKSIIIAGLGGQGVQLLSKVLAHAALAEGRHVMLSAEYGGEMRGGRSFASVVIGLAPLRSLPVVEEADMAIVLHEKFWEQSASLAKSGALIFAEGEFLDKVGAKCVSAGRPCEIVGVNALARAKEAGSALGGGLTLLAAFCAHASIVSVDRLVSVMADMTPPYRKQHVATNEAAMRAGAALAPIRYVQEVAA